MACATAITRERRAQHAATNFLRTLRRALEQVEPEEIFQPAPWGDEDLEEFQEDEDWGPGEEQPGLEGLGSFFKKAFHAISNIVTAPVRLISPKLADNMQKLDNKVIETADKIHTKINDAAKRLGKSVMKALGKNWKWIVIVIAIAITIYTMGAGAGIAAHLISGMEALGHAIAAGAAAVGHIFVGGAAAAGGGAAAGGSAAAAGLTAGGAAVGGGAAATAAASTSWLTVGKLAFSAAKALYKKAKVSDLSQQQAQAMLAAQAQGVNLGADDPQFQAALQQRAAIPGLGIPTDANGYPLVNPAQIGAGTLLPDGTLVPVGQPLPDGTLAPGGYGNYGGYGGGGGAGFGGSSLPSWVMPMAIVGGLGLMAFALSRR